MILLFEIRHKLGRCVDTEIIQSFGYLIGVEPSVEYLTDVEPRVKLAVVDFRFSLCLACGEFLRYFSACLKCRISVFERALDVQIRMVS